MVGDFGVGEVGEDGETEGVVCYAALDECAVEDGMLAGSIRIGRTIPAPHSL